jgi:hypothetical protein
VSIKKPVTNKIAVAKGSNKMEAAIILRNIN